MKTIMNTINITNLSDRDIRRARRVLKRAFELKALENTREGERLALLDDGENGFSFMRLPGIPEVTAFLRVTTEFNYNGKMNQATNYMAKTALVFEKGTWQDVLAIKTALE